MLVQKKTIQKTATSPKPPPTNLQTNPQPAQQSPPVPGAVSVIESTTVASNFLPPTQSTEIYILIHTFHPSDPTITETTPQVLGVFVSLPLAMAAAESYIAHKIIPMVRSAAKRAGCPDDDEIDELYSIVAGSHGPASWTVDWRELEGRNVIELWVEEKGVRVEQWEREDMPVPVGGEFRHGGGCLCCNQAEGEGDEKRGRRRRRSGI